MNDKPVDQAIEPASEQIETPRPAISRRLLKAAIPVALGSTAAGCASRSEVIMADSPAICNEISCTPASTQFQRIVDREVRTRFTRQDESRFVDWMKISVASANLNRINSDKAIINLLLQCRQYQLGFPINTLDHCLQTATRAVNDNASDELVLAALLHDIGIAISYSGHAQISAAMIRTAVSDSVYRVVLHHQEFELAHYGHLVGESTTMRTLYQNEDWYDMAANFVDNWVQVSYDPHFDTLPLEEFVPLIETSFSGFSPSDLEVTMNDCFVETTP